MSHKLFSVHLLVCALFCLPGFRPSPAQRRLPLPPITLNVLSPEQAKRALETLSDDKKRAQMIETLRAVANASQQPQAAAARSPNRNPPYRSPPTAWARNSC